MKGYFEYGVEVQWDGSNSLPAMMERDCLVEVEFKLHRAKETGVAGRFNWMMVKSYKVIDDRHNHFDLGELPPVGVECEVEYNSAEIKKKFHRVIPVFYSKSLAIFEDVRGGEVAYFIKCCKFRPIRTEREKFIEAAMSVAEALYDAGFKAPEQQ